MKCKQVNDDECWREKGGREEEGDAPGGSEIIPGCLSCDWAAVDQKEAWRHSDFFASFRAGKPPYFALLHVPFRPVGLMR